LVIFLSRLREISKKDSLSQPLNDPAMKIPDDPFPFFLLHHPVAMIGILPEVGLQP
jgi:hypothetical protein